MSNLAAGNGRSPTDIASPTQLASNSDLTGVSDSSISPQTPQTPQLYGRMRPRYPQELGRVPLHRRGRSRTYERLEDLLKEAGYKETRIFTPETERTSKCEDDDDDATVVEDKRTSMVKDVVGFLAGLIPGVSASVAGSGAQPFGSKVSDRSTNNPLFPPQQSSPPLSPSANKATLPPLSLHGQRAHDVDLHPTRPQIVIHPTTSHHNQAPGQQSHQGPPASPHHLHAHKHHPAYPKKPHGLGLISTSNTHLAPPHTANAHSPRPSRATAYLRHMASAPSVIPKRPNSTPAGLSHSHRSNSRVVSLSEGDARESLKSQSGNSGSNEQQPPLPTSWLETVAKAVLFGGSGAHVGGPVGSQQVANADSNHHKRRTSPVRQLRPSRSSLSQVSHNSRYYGHHQHRTQKYDGGGLSDSTNFSPSTATSSVFLSPGLPPPMPPALFSQIERGRADRCVSEVSLTRVMCRSAPGSRSGSVVRPEGVGTGIERNRRKNVDAEWGVGTEREARGRKRGVKRRVATGGGWLKGRDKEKLRVPSLARMHVEGDAWSSNMKTRKRSRPEPGSVVGIAPGKGKTGYASEGEVAEYESYSDESGEEDEEEGEVNLARMLLPPKRQNSIRSLRKHLLASVGDSGAHAKLRRVHHLTSAGKKGGGPKSVDGRLRRSTSLARNPTDEAREDGHHNTDVPSSNLNSPNHLHPVSLGWRNAGDIEDGKRRNSCSDHEDVDSFAGFFDVDRKKGFTRDPMGSGRSSTSGQRLGIGNVWGVIGGRGS